jgi:hypothetical protein
MRFPSEAVLDDIGQGLLSNSSDNAIIEVSLVMSISYY